MVAPSEVTAELAGKPLKAQGALFLDGKRKQLAPERAHWKIKAVRCFMAREAARNGGVAACHVKRIPN
jgi:hypothetical protein